MSFDLFADRVDSLSGYFVIKIFCETNLDADKSLLGRRNSKNKREERIVFLLQQVNEE